MTATESTAAEPEVRMLRYPADDGQRAALAEHGFAVLLLVETGSAPPLRLFPLEDWVRADADALELHARLSALGAKARVDDRITIDEFDVLRFQGRWVALRPGEVGIVELLVARFGEIVRNEVLERAAGQSSEHGRSYLRVRIGRLRRQLHTVGLDIRNVRNRGYVLVRTT